MARVTEHTEYDSEEFEEEFDGDLDGEFDGGFGPPTAIDRETDIGPVALPSYARPYAQSASTQPSSFAKSSDEEQIPEARRSFPSSSYSGWEQDEPARWVQIA